MLPLETKQSGGNLLPLSDLWRGVFLEKVSRSRKRNRDISLGTWNVRSLYRAGSLMAAARELARYKLDLGVGAGGEVEQSGHSESRGL